MPPTSFPVTALWRGWPRLSLICTVSVLAMVLPGCFDFDLPTWECDANYAALSCGSGQTCVDNVCRSLCGESVDCPANEVCEGTVCAEFSQGCDTSVDCPADFACVDGGCDKLAFICSPDLQDCASRASCVDFGGRFVCRCDEGYDGDPFEAGCTDVDECATQRHECGHLASCTNTAGAYTCYCGDGLEPDLVASEHCMSRWLAVAVGETHGCAISADSRLWCFGANDRHQSGRIGTHPSPVPVQVGVANDWSQIGAGNGFSCGLRGTELFCFGDSTRGQTGQTVGAATPLPEQIDGTWLNVAVGHDHACAISSTYGLFCWGSNDFGEIPGGIGSTQVGALAVAPERTLDRVTAGHGFTCTIDNTDTLHCFGTNELGQLGDPDATQGAWVTHEVQGGFAAVHAGASHTCALSNAGDLYCFGDNGLGQADPNSDLATTSVPTQVTGLGAVVAFAAGDSFTCVAGNESTRCFGDNGQGQLATGDRLQIRGQRSANLPNLPVTLAAGFERGFAIDAEGFMTSWGKGNRGERGNGLAEYLPSRVVQQSAIGVAAAGDTTCMVGGTGVVSCAGSNAAGQFGGGDPIPASAAVFTDDTLAVAVQQLALGDTHACAIGDDGILSCWGANDRGQLGLSAGSEVLVPNRLTDEAAWSQVCVGTKFTCAMRDAGNGKQGTQCFGNNTSGQLGRGDGSGVSHDHKPAGISLLASAQSITCGDEHGCVLAADGVYCWGATGAGQRGQSATSGPSLVQSLGTPVALAAGHDTTCVVSAGGEVSCVGLIPGTGVSSSQPQVIAQMVGGGPYAVAVGGPSEEPVVCATSAEEMTCFGSNSTGLLGAGHTDPVLEAVQTPLRIPFVSVRIAERHACALDLAGDVWCWGGDDQGQLGDGDAWKPRPVEIWAQ